MIVIYLCQFVYGCLQMCKLIDNAGVQHGTKKVRHTFLFNC